MRILSAKKQHVCGACQKVIQVNEDYWGTSFNAFCKKCGELKQNGKLVYQSKTHRYVETSIKKTAKCEFCDMQADNFIKNVPCCDEHIGNAMGGYD